jgi:hypothetical protein
MTTTPGPGSLERKWLWAALAAVLVYLLWAALLIAQNPGFQYDEALLVLGGVHMRISAGEFNLPHDPDTWFCSFGRCLQLMTVRYVGAVKDYLSLPLFAVFGPSAELVRALSALLGALGIWGIAVLVGEQFSRPAGAATAMLIAMNPAYAAFTVFDNGTVSVWMAALGLLCLAVTRYLRRETARDAFWVGFATGFGIWARANFVWLAGAVAVAALLVLGKRLLSRGAHWAAIVVGGLVGGAPLLVYQVLSRGGTLEALNMAAAGGSLLERLQVRLVQFSEVLLSDREHRVMWDGPAMPEWQLWLFPAAVVAGWSVCVAWAGRLGERRSALVRMAALVFALLAATMFFARLQVAEHHLVALAPLAAVVVVLASAILGAQFRWWRVPAAALAIVYLGAALDWQVSAIRGLGKTGGAGPWSDAIYSLAERLLREYPSTEIQILDWGLQNNLYILTGGRLHTREIFADARPWAEEIRKGGVFLLNGPENRQFPEASAAFLDALAAAEPQVRRFSVRQRNGAVYAELIEIEPGSGRDSPRSSGAGQPVTDVSASDLTVANRLEGFHQVEAGEWRWTTRRFAVTLDAPDLSGQALVRLMLHLHLPGSSLEKLGPVTLTAAIGGRALPPETYRQPGRHTFTRDLEAEWLRPGPNRIEFVLDKALAPAAADNRELGVVVVGASLTPR